VNALSLAVTLLAIAITACKGPDPTKTAQASAASTTFSVDPVAVVEKALDVTVSLPGELTPFEQADIYPRANGFVRAVKVDRGSAVKIGQMLAQLEAPELTSQRIEAEAKVAGEKSTVDRLQAAQKQTPGAVAEHDIELAQAAFGASAAKVAALRTMEGYLVVTAPFDGVVTERNIHPGALVGPPASGKGTPMLKMELVAKLRLTIAVPEDQTSAVKAGDVLDFTVPAWPERKFKALVARVAHAVDTRTRTMPIECDVHNTDGALSSGMYATVAWHERRSAPTLFVPDSAIVQGTDKTFVVRIQDGKANPVTVRRGVSMAGLVEVFGELHAGDVIAKRGSEELKPGTAVTLRPPAAPSASASGGK
jgi:membrane fusion protein (multidrug efflux system)